MEERTRGNANGTTGQSTTESLPQQAAQVKDQVQQAAVGLKAQVAGQATTRLEDQKSVASDGINTFAQAIRKTGEQLRGQEQDGVAQYVDRAAEQLEQFAGYLSKRDLTELARDAEQFARREPALFLGGAFALGLVAARFLKSSGQAAQPIQPTTNDWRGQSEWYGQQPALPAGRPQASTPPPIPATYPRASTGLAGSASMSRNDVIVGGPPITDALVGGPPIERKREF